MVLNLIINRNTQTFSLILFAGRVAVTKANAIGTGDIYF